jgi:hypothetical protein
MHGTGTVSAEDGPGVDHREAIPIWLNLRKKERRMILAPLFGATLVVSVATGPMPDDTAGNLNLSAQQKRAAMQPLVQSATDCVIHAVTSDPRYGTKPIADLGDIIVDSMPSCVAPVQAMIDIFDKYYGKGSGEAFFMGPYLDALPKAVIEASKKAAAP